MLLLGVAYPLRRRLVTDVGMWRRRTRLTRDGDRLLRSSTAIISPPPSEAESATSIGYAVALSALRGMGLAGPGADDVARAMIVELLTSSHISARVLMSQDDMARLFGASAATAEFRRVPDLLMLNSLQDVVTELEAEILRRTGQRSDSAAPVDMPWLFVFASPGAAAERLHRIIQGGAEDLILGVLLEDWPYGITCTVDAGGLITDLEGRSAPAWVGRRLSVCPPASAAARLSGLGVAAHKPGDQASSE
jgi:hypothetical protein